MTDTNYIIPVNIALGDNWPSDIFELESDISVLDNILSNIGISYLNVKSPACLNATLIFRKELLILIPGINGLALVFGNNDKGLTELNVDLNLHDPFLLSINDFPLRLRFSRKFLIPVKEESGVLIADPNKNNSVEVGIRPSITFNGNGEIGVTNLETLDISSVFMVGNTGLLVDMQSFKLILDDSTNIWTGESEEPPQHEWPSEFRGVWIPRCEVNYKRGGTSFPSIEILNAAIGTGGFTGVLSLGELSKSTEDISENILNKEEPLPAHLVGLNTEDTQLNEMQVIFQYFGIVFKQSIPTTGIITGHILMPFVEKWIKFKASFCGPNGEIMLDIGGSMNNPLIKLENDWIKIEADSIAYEMKDGVHYAIVSGSIKPKPKLDNLDWPKIKVDRIWISSHGDIEIEGGWINVPNMETLDFHAFKINIEEIGLGNEGRSHSQKQWLGFSGAVDLVESIGLRASVEGLKFSWPQEWQW